MTAWTDPEQISYLLERADHERAAAERAHDRTSQDAHFMIAERYADEAWSLAEHSDGPYIPSGLWK